MNLESSHGEPGRLLCEGCVEVSLRRLSAGNLQTLAEHACVCASRRLMKCMHTYSFPRSPMSPSISGIQEITQPRRIPFHLILLGRRSAQYRQGKSTRLFHAISVYNYICGGGVVCIRLYAQVLHTASYIHDLTLGEVTRTAAARCREENGRFSPNQFLLGLFLHAPTCIYNHA